MTRIKHIFSLFVFLFAFHLCSYSQTNNDKQLADQFFQNGEYDKAVILYEKLFDKYPTDDNYNAYFKCLLTVKDYEKAEKMIKKLVKKNPKNLYFTIDLGFLYATENQQDKAKEQYEKVLKQLVPNQQLINAVANAFIAKKEYDYAIATYLKGRNLLKGEYAFRFELAEIYAAKQRIPEMIEEYLDVLFEDQNLLQPVQNLLQNKLFNNPDKKKIELYKTLLFKRVQKYPEKNIYNELLLNFFVQQKDFESALIQAKALDKRFNENGERLIQLASLSVSNESYDAAVKAYQYVISKGNHSTYYLTARIELLNTINKKLVSSLYTQNDLQELEKEYYKTLDELGKNAGTVQLIKGLAHLQAFYLNKIDDAQKLLEEIIATPSITPQFLAECKLELGDILVLSGDVWEATLLYEQVDKAFRDDPIGQEAKFKNAKLSYFNGEFEWAKAQLDVLKSATHQLIANDAMQLSMLISDNTDLDSSIDALLIYAHAELVSFQNKDSLALLTLDSILTNFPKHALSDETYFKKAQIMKKQGRFKEAAEFLQTIITNYPEDILADDALFNLAELTEKNFKDSTKAMELYQQLLTKYTGSLFVVEARKRYRVLRGDHVN